MIKRYIVCVDGYDLDKNENSYFVDKSELKLLKDIKGIKFYNLENWVSGHESVEYDIIQVPENVVPIKIKCMKSRADNSVTVKINSEFELTQEVKDIIEATHKVNANDNKLYFHYLADLVIADTPEGLREKLSENDFAQVHLQGESLEIINKYFES